MKRIILLSVIVGMGTAFCADRAPKDGDNRARSQSSPAVIIGVEAPLTQDQQEMLQAVRNGEAETLKQYKSKKEEIEACNYGFGKSLLHIAVSDPRTLNVEVVRFLVVDCAVDVNAADTYKKTPLHCLVENCHFHNNPDAIKCANILLSKNANIDAKANGYTPLDYAVTRCGKAVAFFLQHHGKSQYSDDRIGKAMVHLLATTCKEDLGNIQDTVNKIGHVKFGSATTIASNPSSTSFSTTATSPIASTTSATATSSTTATTAITSTTPATSTTATTSTTTTSTTSPSSTSSINKK